MSYRHETWSKGPPQWYVILTKFHDNSSKIVDFLLEVRAYPPTPRSQFDNSDVGTDHEYDHYHRYTEGSPFIPPPPTRSGSPTLEDD